MTSKNDELILSRMWAEKAQAIEAYGGPVTAQVYATLSLAAATRAISAPVEEEEMATPLAPQTYDGSIDPALCSNRWGANCPAISSRVHWCKLFKNHAPAVHTCYCGEPHE